MTRVLFIVIFIHKVPLRHHGLMLQHLFWNYLIHGLPVHTCIYDSKINNYISVLLPEKHYSGRVEHFFLLNKYRYF